MLRKELKVCQKWWDFETKNVPNLELEILQAQIKGAHQWTLCKKYQSSEAYLEWQLLCELHEKIPDLQASGMSNILREFTQLTIDVQKH